MQRTSSINDRRSQPVYVAIGGIRKKFEGVWPPPTGFSPDDIQLLYWEVFDLQFYLSEEAYVTATGYRRPTTPEFWQIIARVRAGQITLPCSFYDMFQSRIVTAAEEVPELKDATVDKPWPRNCPLCQDKYCHLMCPYLKAAEKEKKQAEDV
ncbi:hypothetical protein BT63DRAFT_455581 [Microthyrium microscopicum]|uniref:Uncharacterized protein n=1 Tax=Microthyrium microscopicum TaxID=703497 RepID=A0A6A6UDF3_9PEZI|nr:hypothetical protein BT63DRAFT_455581 [Microthyrium microscopicum]